MANRNRTAGHNYERQVVKDLKSQGYEDAVTTRSESRTLDNLGIDVISRLFPHDIQCKISKGLSSKQVRHFLDRGREEKPLVIMHKHVENTGGKFMPRGDYVYMKLHDYYNLIKQIHGEKFVKSWYEENN